MNEYNLRVTFDITVNAENESQAHEQAQKLEYNHFDIWDISTESVKENIEKYCFMCEKEGTDGNDDKMCTECFTKWSKDYDKRHPK